MNLTKITEDASTITLGWTAVAGATGYRFTSEKQAKPSHSWDPTKSSVKFAKGSDWYKVEALGVLDVGNYPIVDPSPIPPGTHSGVSYLNYGSSRAPTSHAGSYDYVILGPGAPVAGLGDCKRPLLYKSSVSVSEQGSAYGMSAQEARALGAILKDPNGVELTNSSYPTNKIGDPGLAAYQAKWCANVLAQLQMKPGMKGLFIDDTNRHYIALSGGRGSAKYPTDDGQLSRSFENALKGFCNYVYNYFHSRGYLVAWNATGYVPGYSPWNDGTSNVEWWTALAPYADGFMAEFWEVVPSIASSRNGDGRQYTGQQAWWQQWDGWLRLVSLGKTLDFDCIALINTGDTAQRDYALASLLLEWDGAHGTLIWARGDYGVEVPWPAAYDRLPITPTGPKRKNGNRWERDTDKGLLWVDPVAGTQGLP